MTQDESGLAGSVKDGVIDAIRGAGEITDAVVDTGASSLVNAIQKTSDVRVVLIATASQVVRGAIQGSAEVSGSLGSAAKGAMIGVLLGQDRGLEPEVAHRYETHVRDGRLLLAARVRRRDLPHVRGILLESGAQEVRDVEGTVEPKNVPRPRRESATRPRF